jgi:hypothetical protein
VDDDQFQAAIDEAVNMQRADDKLKALERLCAAVISERRVLRFLTVMSFVIGGAAVVLSLISLDALNRFEQERGDARHASCVAFNDQQRRSVDANEAQLRVVIEALTAGREQTEEGKARIQTLYEMHDRVIEDAFPGRDCTPTGIEAYFSEHKN